MYFAHGFTSIFWFLGSALISNHKILQLRDLGYKEIAGTYKCTVTSAGGKNSGSRTLEVYCKSCCIILCTSFLFGHGCSTVNRSVENKLQYILPHSSTLVSCEVTVTNVLIGYLN